MLGETAIPTSDPTTLENHADRPEVRQALAGERAVVERRSASLGENLVYAAVLAEVAGRSVVLRLSTPADPESTAILRAFWMLAGAGLLGFVLLWSGGYALESRFHAPVAGLAREVRAMSEGKVGPGPSRSDYPAELGEVAGALHDLAEELQGRVAALRRQRDEMQALIDSIAEGVIALTEDARVLRMNPAAVSLLDIAPPPPFAPIGTLIRHPDLRDHLEESVILPLPAREFRLGDRHLLVSSRLLGSGGAVVTLSDVTELRRIEQVRRDFVANASHELKTPLTAVRGFAETLLEEETRDGVGRNFLQSIRDNTLRLQHLVDDLLDLSRLESGTWTPNEEEIDVVEAATAAWRELASENRHRSIGFAVEGEAVVLADGQALHQIFRNLFDNAVRYTADGGSVRVKISPEGPLVETAVSDTGSGIPSSALPRIFERFYRVDTGRDRAAGGTGLGLAIVRHLVQSMGGRI
ncbi:MAG TPA: ATP-binding protein, partial [Vicinamibacteria bacterium]